MNRQLLEETVVAIGQYQVARRRLSPHRVHKASSAESIARHVIRRRGWTAAYKRGELTGQQHLELLQDVRQYARDWMRHEAEVLFKVHGREIDDVERLGSRAGDAAGYLHVSGRDHGGSAREDRDPSGSFGAGAGISGRVQSLDRALSDALAHHVGRFFGRAKSFIREAIVAGAMVFGGPAPLDAQDLAEADHQARVQAEFLDRFQAEAHFRTPEEIAVEGEAGLNPMTAPQFIARAEQYGGSVHKAAQDITRKGAVRAGAVRERRFHGLEIDDMCYVCRSAVAKGWSPIGTLPAIGDSPCVGSCHCYFAYEMTDGSVYITARGWKK